ncbi:hypothetical protein [Hamadaea sp.]|uniref:hypothetical protein n=1 Tax=Hamadaea sp. TaxID=2024425 RepID=UPI0025C488D1|nr:hypothetical protein [Hamadaea sp.]
MTTFPVRPIPLSTPKIPSLDALKEGPLDRVRRQREEKARIRQEAAGTRAANHLNQLGPAWQFVEWPHSVATTSAETASAPGRAADTHGGFLAFGPGGVFSVTVVDIGSKRVLVAGDVVQIKGRRPAYIPAARKDAKRASKAISAATGHTIPVVPVLALMGRGVVTVYGLPKDCVITTYRELHRALLGGGERISVMTAQKLSDVARNPWTWINEPANAYRWFTDGKHDE